MAATMTPTEWELRAKDVRRRVRAAFETVKVPTEPTLMPSKKLFQFFSSFGLTRSVPGRGPGSEIVRKATEMDVEFALLGMGLSPYHIHDGVFLRYETVERWVLKEVLGDRGDRRNILLVRAPLGQGKQGYHRMPPVGTFFGVATAGGGPKMWDLMHNIYARPEERGPVSRVRQYFPSDAAHPKPPRFKHPFDAENTRFGDATSKLTPIADLVNNKFAVEGRPGMEMAPDRVYAPDEGMRVATGKLPPPRPTRASSALASTNKSRFAPMGVVGHAALHATYVERAPRPRPATAQ